MTKPMHFKRGKRKFDRYGGPPGKASIARLITPDISKTMGGGIAKFDGCSIEWTVLYDEIIVVLDGKFRLRLGKGYKQKIEARPGDVICPRTPLKYEGDKAVVVYALDPSIGVSATAWRSEKEGEPAARPSRRAWRTPALVRDLRSGWCAPAGARRRR
jgi:ethanolamine utilization protein EutQ